MSLAWWYIAAASLLTCLLFAVDKRRAMRGAWRVPEARLWLAAALGGAAGGVGGMQLFRHTTRHAAFRWGMPVLAALQLGLMSGLSLWFAMR